MASVRFCSNCGHPLSATASFCPQCGTSSNPNTSATTAARPNRIQAPPSAPPPRHRMAESDPRIIAALIGAAAVIIVGIVGLFAGPKIFILSSPPASSTTVPTSPTVTSPTAQTSQAKETQTFSLASGLNGFKTDHSYVGTITLMVSGIGQAKQSALEDPLYIYTDFNRNPINAYHDPSFSLCINYTSVDHYWQGRPAFSETHTYTFKVTIPAPGGHLVFGICDNGVNDNTGSFTITIY